MLDVKVNGRWYDLDRVPSHLLDTPQEGTRVSTDDTRCPRCNGGKLSTRKYVFLSRQVDCDACFGTGVKQN